MLLLLDEVDSVRGIREQSLLIGTCICDCASRSVPKPAYITCSPFSSKYQRRFVSLHRTALSISRFYTLSQYQPYLFTILYSPSTTYHPPVPCNGVQSHRPHRRTGSCILSWSCGNGADATQAEYRATEDVGISVNIYYRLEIAVLAMPRDSVGGSEFSAVFF